MNFIRVYEEKYSSIHPVFYQGTYSQVLNDAKRELKFLLIYLHNDDSVDTTDFCKFVSYKYVTCTNLKDFVLFLGTSWQMQQ